MARKRTNTLSDTLLADIREANRRVLRKGVSGGSGAPFGNSPVAAPWLIITDAPAAGDADKKFKGYLSTIDDPDGRIAADTATDVKAVRVGGAPCPYIGQACMIFGRRKYGDDWCYQLIVPGDGRFLCGINGKWGGSYKYKCDGFPYLAGADDPAANMNPSGDGVVLSGGIFEDSLFNDFLWSATTDNFQTIGTLRGYWDAGGGTKRPIFYGPAIPSGTC